MIAPDIGAALLLGLAGAGHCLGMCGGVAMALRAPAGSSALLPVSYHLGRLLSYAALGGLLGGAAGAIELAAWSVFLRFAAGFLLLAMGLHTLKLWYGITRLERVGAVIWQRLAPTAKRLLPPTTIKQGLLLGALWGFMPCGLIYSALTWSAAAAASTFDSALLMLAFGAGTLPAMLGTTLLGQRVSGFLRHRLVRTTMGAALIIAGLWTLWLTVNHMDHWLNPPAGTNPRAMHQDLDGKASHDQH